METKKQPDTAITTMGRSGKVQGKLRGLVSQNRRRFLKHGFDLDCTYITNRVRPRCLPTPARPPDRA
jgi:hypothetical protein